MPKLLFVILILINTITYAKDRLYPVRLGDTIVTISQESNGPGKFFIHVHANEISALKAARDSIKKEGGTVITLKHKKSRNIEFTLNNKKYIFDPNRIFTNNGIKNTLSNLSNYSPEAHKEVQKLAEKLISLIPKSGKIIAVHNNSEYSLHNYLPGNSLENEAKLLHVNNKNSYRNFYLITQKVDFLRLSKKNFNAVLQAPKAIDDGSLSIRLSNREYINVEAGHNQLSAQKTMLKNS